MQATLRPGHIRELPSYVRFTTDEISHKVRLLAQRIRDLGTDFSQEKLDAYEQEVNLAILDSRQKAVRRESELLSPQSPPGTVSGTGFWGFYGLSKADLMGWTAADIPVLALSSRWALATDLSQWCVYHRKGEQWRAQYFPTTTQSLLWFLKSEVPDIDPLVLAKIRGWPSGHINQWRIGNPI